MNNYSCFTIDRRDIPKIRAIMNWKEDTSEFLLNVNDVITRDDVWRVVKNGYPYKTCQEMGLSNNFDAFAVTKFAVYCITGQSSLEKFYAEPDDSEAVAMLNALRNLVNIGINGTETRTAGNFSISKNGEFEEEGEFYYQNYIVNSNLDMKDVNVEIVNNYGKG